MNRNSARLGTICIFLFAMLFTGCATLNALFSFGGAPVNPLLGRWCAYDEFFDAETCYQFTSTGSVSFSHGDFGTKHTGTYIYDAATVTIDFSETAGTLSSLDYQVQGQQLNLIGVSPLAGAEQIGLGIFEKR